MDREGMALKLQRGRRLFGIAAKKPWLGPAVVSLEITHACNLRCSFCESHGSLMPAPITSLRQYVGNRRTMTLDTVRSLSRSLAKLGIERVELSGKGDPIAHPQLAEVVRILKEAGLPVILVTNGTMGQPHLAATLVDCGLDWLSVSLNAGSREVFAKVAGKDLWDRAMAFVREVLERRRAAGTHKPEVRFTYVVCKDNVEDLDRVVTLAADLGIDKLMWTLMGEMPETVSLQLGPEEVQAVAAGIPGWSRRLEAAGVEHDLPRLAAELPLRSGKPAQQDNPLQRELPCYVGSMFTVIGPDGTVVPCCYCEETRLGNVVEQDFTEIWRGPAYEEFRRAARAMPQTGRWICRECFTTCNRALENQRIHRRLSALRVFPSR